MKAYYCNSVYFDVSAIIFADTRGKAKWAFIDQFCDGDMSDVSCRRMKKVDHHGKASAIPFRELIWLGWWSECHHCGEILSEDNLQEAGKDIDSVVGNYNGSIYCCPECHEEYLADTEERRKMEDRIAAHMMWRLEDRLVGAEIEFVTVYASCDPKKDTISAARIEAVVDSHRMGFGGSVSSEFGASMSFEEWKKQDYILHVPRKDLPYFKEKYGLEKIIP